MLATAENAESAKVQYIDFYPTLSDSSVCFTVVKCQFSISLCSLLFPQCQTTMCWLRHVRGTGTPFVGARTDIIGLTSIQEHMNASNASVVISTKRKVRDVSPITKENQ